MHVRVILKVFALGIVCDVKQLSTKIIFIADAVLMITGVPDPAGSLVRQREGIAAFDELNAS